MSQFLPYILVVGTIIVFFAVCYLVYSGDDKKKEHREETPVLKERHHAPSQHSVGEGRKGQHTPVVQEPETVRSESKSVQVHRKETKTTSGYLTKDGRIVGADGEVLYSEKRRQEADNAENTRVLKREEVKAAIQKARTAQEYESEKEEKTGRQSLADIAAVVAADLAAKEADKVKPREEAVVSDATQPVPVLSEVLRKGETPEAPVRQEMTEERVVPSVRVQENDKAEEQPWRRGDLTESPVIFRCTEHFLKQYTIVRTDLKKQVQYITDAAFRSVGATLDDEREKVLSSFAVQDALRQVQKTYTAHPESFVEAVVTRAFADVVRCPETSTRHLVATDALKVMPSLSRPHYRILALLLLFLYSRNTHNVDKETFGQYMEKYVLPVVDRFPTERPYYQQLDYLHCTAVEAKGTTFAALLGDSYPLLFRYRGFTEEELRKALQDEFLPGEFVVQSFNSPLYKLALIDETMSSRFFRMAGIEDRGTQDRLLRLARKRPANFSGEEALDVMEGISPVLADISDIWDSTMLRVSTLSLLGLYLGQGYIKEIIGEEFDLSRWFE